jgi:hypothetical protein
MDSPIGVTPPLHHSNTRQYIECLAKWLKWCVVPFMTTLPVDTHHFILEKLFHPVVVTSLLKNHNSWTLVSSKWQSILTQRPSSSSWLMCCCPYWQAESSSDSSTDILQFRIPSTYFWGTEEDGDVKNSDQHFCSNSTLPTRWCVHSHRTLFQRCRLLCTCFPSAFFSKPYYVKNISGNNTVFDAELEKPVEFSCWDKTSCFQNPYIIRIKKWCIEVYIISWYCMILSRMSPVFGVKHCEESAAGAADHRL